MKNKLVKLWVLASMVSLIVFHTKVEAATFGLSASKKEVTVGESFNVTISGIYGKATISGKNVQLSTNGSQFVDGSLTITATTKSVGNATVTVTVSEAATTGKDPQEVSGTKSVSVVVKEKQAKPVTQPAKQTTTTTATTQNNKNTTTKKATQNTKKTETKKTQVVEVKEKEEASSEFGIHNLKVIGVKENGEEMELTLDKPFNIKTLEYTSQAENDIKTVKFEKEAYEYNDLVQILGLDEGLKEGENVITLKLQKDEKEISYLIKIVKEAKKEEAEPTNTEPVVEEQEKEPIMVQIPLIWFILLEIAIMGASVGITIAVMLHLKQDSTKQENTIPKKRRNRKQGM